MSTEVTPSESSKKSGAYDAILKSTSIVGGSQAINYVIALLRTKLVATLLGPSGVGMVGLFNSSIMWVMQLTGLGIRSSGVRQIAKAHGADDQVQIGKTVRILRRACWATGALGWIVTAALSRPLSIWAFNSDQNAWLIAVLGVSLLLAAVSGGQKAIIQGTRRISDLAWMTVLSALLSTVVAIAIYWLIGVNGIVPALVATAAINLLVSWWFARKIEIPVLEPVTWTETFREGKDLTNLGVAFMWGGLLAALVDLGIRALIVREVSLEATGYYQAAWGLSGMFANFILAAMGADFYPRLTSIADDHQLVNSAVNEQIEVGILIALPGLIGTLALGPLIITVLYTSEFVIAATVLPWFILGVFLRVVSWPIGFAILAKGASKWFLLTQTVFHGTNFILAWFLIPRIGIVGAGIGFFITFIPSTLLNLGVAKHLTEFTWSKTVIKLLIFSSIVIAFAFLSSILLDPWICPMLCLPLLVVTGVYCLRGIVQRVGAEHRINKTLQKVPGIRLILPI